MASAFAHAFSAFAFGKAFTIKKQPVKFWVAGIVSSVMPDADVIAFRFGIPYEHMLGHRGLTHSLFFALIWSVLVTIILFREHKRFSKPWAMIVAYLFTCTASHGLLDAMTTGGLGVAFFAPFDSLRYFLPFRPILVSPLSVDAFFTEWGMRVISSEMIWVGVPCVLMILFAYLFRIKA